MTYSIEYTRAAKKQIAKLPKKVAGHLNKVLAVLAENPYPPIAGRLVNHNLWKIRIDNRYRLIYQVFENQLIVFVVRIDHRSRAYENLTALEEQAALNFYNSIRNGD